MFTSRHPGLNLIPNHKDNPKLISLPSSYVSVVITRENVFNNKTSREMSRSPFNKMLSAIDLSYNTTCCTPYPEAWLGVGLFGYLARQNTVPVFLSDATLPDPYRVYYWMSQVVDLTAWRRYPISAWSEMPSRLAQMFKVYIQIQKFRRKNLISTLLFWRGKLRQRSLCSIKNKLSQRIHRALTWRQMNESET